MTIGRVLLSGEARAGYVPNEGVATYRELVRLHSQLSEQAARFQNQIHALVMVLFPEFTQVFADPCLSSAIAVLKAYPSAQAMAQAGEAALYALLRAHKHAHYGHPTAKKLLQLASTSVIPICVLMDKFEWQEVRANAGHCYLLERTLVLAAVGRKQDAA